MDYLAGKSWFWKSSPNTCVVKPTQTEKPAGYKSCNSSSVRFVDDKIYDGGRNLSTETQKSNSK